MTDEEQKRAVARFLDAYCKDWVNAVLLRARNRTLPDAEKARYAVAFASKTFFDVGLAQTAEALMEMIGAPDSGGGDGQSG